MDTESTGIGELVGNAVGKKNEGLVVAFCEGSIVGFDDVLCEGDGVADGKAVELIVGWDIM